MQKSIFPQNFLKILCITTKSLLQIQTQLSRKLQRFRTCRKNKKCSIFHDLSEYIIFSYGCKLLDWSFKIYWNLKSVRVLNHLLRNITSWCIFVIFILMGEKKV